MPYLYAYLSAKPDMMFTGFLSNPIDGNSYLAKMRQGERGNWLFHLPYTPEEHEGAFVFAFYLFLGRISRGFPLILTYHMARVIAGFFLLVVAYLFSSIFLRDIASSRTAFLLIGLSSGIGWSLLPFGIITSDLWVPEAITFYSIFVNPHFPLAVALMLLTFALVTRWFFKSSLALACLTSLLLALVQPLCVLTLFAVLTSYILLLTLKHRRFPWPETVGTFLTGLVTSPVIIYYLYVFATNTALRAWSAQNITLSPPLWDYAASYGLVLAFALAGIVCAIKTGEKADVFLLSWVMVNAALLYLPFNLQRRLVTGLHIPFSILATKGLFQYILPRFKRKALLIGVLIVLTIPTNISVLFISLSGAAKNAPLLYLHKDEMEAMAWLLENTQPTDVVLASPGTSLFIPAWAGNRVIYGHPFETIDAERKRELAEIFFEEETSNGVREEIIRLHRVAYVFYGPREKELLKNGFKGFPFTKEVYKSGMVTIFRIEEGGGRR